MPEAESIFILPPSKVELEKRLRGRGTDSDEVIENRLEQSCADMTHYDEFDYVVITIISIRQWGRWKVSFRQIV